MRYICIFIFAWLWCTTSVAQNPVSFTSSNLPIVVIKTNGGTIVDDPKIIADMGIIDNGAGVPNNLTDPYNGYSGKIAIEIRGSSSQMFPKKQYGMELRADDGEEDNEQSLFGMPEEGDWILFAPYNDKTLLRDALSYTLARRMGNYASRSRFFELVLNNEYMGVYVFFEKVKRGKNRVNIDKLEEDEITGDKLTGGYILKIDKTTGGDEGGFVSQFPPPKASGTQKTYFQWEYPKGKDIVPEQKTYIENYVKQFETTLASETYNDPVEGWTKYADMNSFIDFFIMNEVSKNPDAYRLSTFMHKRKDSDGGKLFMGPVWDFNLGFGNVNYCTQGDAEGLVIDFNTLCPTDGWLIPFWWQKLWSDQTFRVALSERWTSLRANEFSNESVLAYVDSVSGVLSQGAAQRNFQKWPVLGTYVWPNYKYDLFTYQAEVSWLRTWIRDRMEYLDATLNFSIAGVNERTGGDVIVHAFPNPFDNDVTFEYEISVPGETKIEIFDVLGRNVSTTVNTGYDAGRYSLKTAIASQPGVYVYRVTHNNGAPVAGKLIRR